MRLPTTILIPPRIWLLSTGTTLTASFLKQEGDAVHLLLEDGEEQQIAMEDIAEADRLYVRKQVIDQKYPPQDRDPPRQWSDRSGSFSVTASILDYEQGTVKLLRDNATEIDVRLGDLSNEDQRHIRQKVLEAKKAEKAKDE